MIESHEISIEYLKELSKRKDFLDKIEEESLLERDLAREYMRDKVEDMYPEVLKSV